MANSPSQPISRTDWISVTFAGQDTAEPLGFLQLCIDPRFHRAIQEQFERLTDLAHTSYWLDTGVGGSPKMRGEDLAPNYCYNHGARIMGWAAHGCKCGGFSPPLHPHQADDREIRDALAQTLEEKVFLYPDAQHYAFFATQEDDPARVVIWFRGPIIGS